MKNKFITIFFIILIILNIFTVYSSASFDFLYDNVTYNFPDLPDNFTEDSSFFIYRYKETGTYNLILIVGSTGLVTYYKDIEMYPSKEHGDCISVSSGHFKCYRYNPDIADISNKWVERDMTGYSLSIYGLLSPSKGYQNTMCYTNFDIAPVGGDVVFQPPALTLGQVLAKTNPVQRYQTMIHGMIISLVVFLVSLVGFLKAWSLLSNSLRKA